MKSLLQKKESPNLLGLSLDGSKIEGVLVKRTNGSVEITKTFSIALTLDLFNNEPELVGQEIRNQLEAAGIKERRCSVCVPLKWALTLNTQLPDIGDEDVDEFLQIEAERGFSLDADALLITRSRYKSGEGAGSATQVAIPLSNLTRLEEALTAAHLKPVSLALGITALQPAGTETTPGVLALVVGEEGIDLQITAGGGIVALRSLAAAIEGEGGSREIDTDFISREIRITLGQLPSEVRDGIRHVRIFGPDEHAQHLVSDLRSMTAAMGLSIEHVKAYGTGELGVQLPAGTPISQALSLAVRRVARKPAELEFLPPKVSAWQQFASRYSSRKLVSVGATAGAIALLVIIAFIVQQYKISTRESEWQAMKSNVEELKGLQDKIRQFRPWYDTSFATLTILKRVTEAFPEDGTVTAKTLEIRNLSQISCTGTTRDVMVLNKTQTELQKMKEVKSVKVENVRGDALKTFNLTMVWGMGGGASENR
jgi:hypothetical protein